MKYLKAVVLNSEVFVTKLILVERQNDVFLAKIVVQYLALHSFDGSGENDSSMLLVRDEVQLLEVNRKQNAHVAFSVTGCNGRPKSVFGSLVVPGAVSCLCRVSDIFCWVSDRSNCTVEC